MSNEAIRDWTAALSVLTALGVIAWGLSREHWIEVFALWPAHIFGLAMVTLAIAKGAPKPLILVTPIFLLPLGMGAMLLYACSQGDCL